MIYKDKKELRQKCSKIIEIDGNDVVILNETELKNVLIDDLIYTAVFSPDQATIEAARWLIRRAGAAVGIISSSIQTFKRRWGAKK